MFINGEEFRARIRCWLLTFLFIDIEVLRTMRRKPKREENKTHQVYGDESYDNRVTNCDPFG